MNFRSVVSTRSSRSMFRRLCQRAHVRPTCQGIPLDLLTQIQSDYDSRTTPQKITQIDGVRDFSIHGARRKPWIKAMSMSALKGYEPIVHLKTGELLEELSKRQGEIINISQWMNLYAYVKTAV